MNEYRSWQRLLAEFLGTALLVLIGAGSVPALALARGDTPLSGADVGFISLAFGAIVAITVYVFGYVSGNHINPAVTLGLAATGKFPWRDVPGYIIAQVLGGIVGALAIVAVLGTAASDRGLGAATYGDIPMWQAFGAEAIGTFVLVLVVFGAIHRRATASMAGLTIGAVVFAVIVVVLPATGAAINPARYAGPFLVQAMLGVDMPWEQVLVYIIAEVIGGIVAGALFVALAKTPSDRRQSVDA